MLHRLLSVLLLRNIADCSLLLNCHQGSTVLTKQLLDVTRYCGCSVCNKVFVCCRDPRTGATSPGLGRRIALDVARGLHFLHARSVVHFDLKSANILLARDFTAKIADVGLAKIMQAQFLSTLYCVGTFAWAAPEVGLYSLCICLTLWPVCLSAVHKSVDGPEHTATWYLKGNYRQVKNQAVAMLVCLYISVKQKSLTSFAAW